MMKRLLFLITGLATMMRAQAPTAQGNRLPTFIANVGLRHDFKGK